MADSNLQVLSVMITPAVLISGAGTLLMSTTSRVGRATDRIRQQTARFKYLVTPEGQQEPMAKEEKRMIMRQLPRLAWRSRLLVRAMTSMYIAVALLVLTSIFIGASALVGQNFGSIPVILAIMGAAALAFGALVLSYEMRVSAKTTNEEMAFLVELGNHYSSLYDKD